MIQYEKQVTNRYFHKIQQCSINDVNEGDIVHITVRSPLHYGIREWSYYGKMIKITRCYFSIIQYCEASSFGGVESNYCSVAHAELFDRTQKERAKRWSKDSLISIHLAAYEDKTEIKTFFRSDSM